MDLTMTALATKKQQAYFKDRNPSSNTFTFKNSLAGPAIDMGFFIDRLFCKGRHQFSIGARAGGVYLSSTERHEYRTINDEEYETRTNDPGGVALSAGVQAGYLYQVSEKWSIGVQGSARYLRVYRDGIQGSPRVVNGLFYFPLLLNIQYPL